VQAQAAPSLVTWFQFMAKRNKWKGQNQQAAAQPTSTGRQRLHYQVSVVIDEFSTAFEHHRHFCD
jgi:hypothetical protein